MVAFRVATILALHGMTMSGASMLRSMGSLVSALEDQGHDIIAPDGGHEMSEQDLEAFLAGVRPVYARSRRAMRDQSREGAFRKDHQHFDWLQSQPIVGSDKKHYHGLEKSLLVLDKAIGQKTIEGVIGFSQGAVLATLLAALGALGDERFPHPNWGIYLGGFPPRVAAPVDLNFPFEAPFARLFVLGERDPIFKGGMTHLRDWAKCFSGGSEEFYIAPTGHDIPRDTESVTRLLSFIEEQTK